MPTYVLEGAGRAVFPRKPVVVSLTVTGGAGSADMHALVDGVPDARAVRPTPGLMVLPRVEAPTILRITPSGSASEFAPGTSLHLSLTVEDRSDPDPDRAVIGPIDVSGESKVDVASLISAVDGVGVSALRSIPDKDLGPVGNSSRSAARLVLGVDQLPDTARISLTIAIDCSASMSVPLADGSVEEVCNIVAGIAAVVSPQSNPRVCVVGDTPRVVEVDASSGLGAAVVQELHESLLVAGFRCTAVPAEQTADSAVTFVITDGMPADAQPGVPGRHFIALTSDSDFGQEWADSTTVVLPPPAGLTAGAHLSGSRQILADTVRSLLRSMVPVGTEGVAR